MDPLTILSVAETLRGGSRKQGVLGMFELIGVKNLLALIGLVVVGFAIAGWYLGWYNIGTEKDAQGNTHVDVKVDAAKVKHDLSEGRDKVENVIEQKTANVLQPPAPAPAPVRPQEPPAPPPSWVVQPPAPPQGLQTPQTPAPQSVTVPQFVPALPQQPLLPPPSQEVDSWPFQP
jgi:hypothetical protein